MVRPALALLALTGLSAAVQAAPPEVIIDPGGVPPAALQIIVGAVDAITRLAEDQDGGELWRLRRRARDATLSALATQGYFSPEVNLEVGNDGGRETWDISIVPGERTTVDNVDLSFTGQIATPEFTDRVKLLREQWPLDKGMPFVNQAWHDGKADLLDGVSRKDFFLARMIDSQATIMAETASAKLEVAIDSGPRVRMGELITLGLRRVPESVIRRYVRYDTGEPYDQDRLDAWQEALQSTTFFRGAFVSLDEDPQRRVELPGGELEMPVRVRVSEAPARRLTTSLGVDSDHGLRLESLYRQNIFLGLPVWIETGVGLDRHRQRGFFDVHFPPNYKGYRDSFGVLFDHSDLHGLDTKRVGIGWKRRQERNAAGDSRVQYETQWGLVAAHDWTRIAGAEDYDVPTLVGTWQWLRRDVDDKYNPREGNLIDFGLGAGVTLDKGEPFYRSSLRAQQWWPVGKRDVLTVRAEVGKVWAHTSRLPEDFGYRTGGSRTIRGYKYQSIGLPRGDAIIGAPALAVASIEYVHYFNQTFGMSLFIDAGDAAASFGDMDIALGYGAGAVVSTPAGPFFVDLAYGQRDRRLRLHFSMGIAF